MNIAFVVNVLSAYHVTISVSNIIFIVNQNPSSADQKNSVSCKSRVSLFWKFIVFVLVMSVNYGKLLIKLKSAGPIDGSQILLKSRICKRRGILFQISFIFDNGTRTLS